MCQPLDCKMGQPIPSEVLGDVGIGPWMFPKRSPGDADSPRRILRFNQHKLLLAKHEKKAFHREGSLAMVFECQWRPQWRVPFSR